jgi:hypothetical protein
MPIATVLAVYKSAPIMLVAESAKGTVCKLSLTNLRRAGHQLSDGAWMRFVEDDQMLTCPSAAGQAWGGRPPSVWLCPSGRRSHRGGVSGVVPRPPRGRDRAGLRYDAMPYSPILTRSSRGRDGRDGHAGA